MKIMVTTATNVNMNTMGVYMGGFLMIKVIKMLNTKLS